MSSDSFFRLFKTSEVPNGRTLSFPPAPGRFLSPDILRGDPFGGKIPPNIVLTLEGKTPHWLYIHAAYWGVISDVRQINVFQPSKTPIVVYPLPEQGRFPASWYRWEERTQNSVRFQMVTLPNDKVSPTVLTAEPPTLPPGIGQVILSGRGANWMYAAAASLAARRGIKDVRCDMPTEKGLLSVGKNAPGTIYPRETPEKEGTVIGVLGDPNSGKSVLTNLLEQLIFPIFGHRCWKYDCDAASPTPSWFISMPAEDKANDTRRRNQKVSWTSELESNVAEKLRSLRTQLTVTLADLPGGYHPQDSLVPPRRIPNGREVIMREVDHFILLGKEGKPGIIPAWRRELAQIGLEERVFAELISGSPDSALSLRWDNAADAPILRGKINGLDRSRTDSKPIRDAACPLVEQIIRFTPDPGD